MVLSACERGEFDAVIQKHHVNTFDRSLVQTYADNDGCTCLFLACISGNLELVKWLINYCNCNPNCRNHHGSKTEPTNSEPGLCFDRHPYSLHCSYATPLHTASLYGHMKIVHFVVSEVKRDVNCKNGYGYTPLDSHANKVTLILWNIFTTAHVIHFAILRIM